ncbi:MAG TPA: phytanoyl-CoA dioxygenase family protein [Planctomycetota bacterium]|nr:phytanoyl-CoA dioxygenase family protein [Planctomycetota bacterium]
MTTATTAAPIIPRLPAPAALAVHLDALEEHGWTVIPGFLDGGTTARLRQHMDALLPPVARDARVHELRHPIPGAIMAELITDQHLALARALLRAGDGLRLLEQVLIRTDPSCGQPAARGWHVDAAFYPRHRAATPRQTYYQCVHALCDIRPGGGATMIVPGSHRRLLAATARIESTAFIPAVRQEELRTAALRLAEIDASAGIELTAREGDLVLFDPTCLHSASANIGASARYVLFQSFIDDSAHDMNAELEARGYRSGFSDDLRGALTPERRRLLRRP